MILDKDKKIYKICIIFYCFSILLAIFSLIPLIVINSSRLEFLIFLTDLYFLNNLDFIMGPIYRLYHQEMTY